MTRRYGRRSAESRTNKPARTTRNEPTRATLIGRPVLYGLGAFGEAGVTRCLEIIRNELDVSMALCGRARIQDVDRSILLPDSK